MIRDLLRIEREFFHRLERASERTGQRRDLLRACVTRLGWRTPSRKYSSTEPIGANGWERIYLQPITPITALTSPIAQEIARLTSPGDTLLEAGCGLASLSAELATAGRLVEICDFSKPILERAIELFKASGLPEPTVTHCDLTQPLPWSTNGIDVVWSSGVLEHWTDEELVPIVAEMARISRKCVISLVPYAGCLLYRLGKYLAEESNAWPYGREIPRQTLAPVFRKAGLASVHEHLVCEESAPSVLRHVSPSLQKMVSEWWSSLPSDDPARQGQGYLLVTIGYKRSLSTINAEQLGNAESRTW